MINSVTAAVVEWNEPTCTDPETCNVSTLVDTSDLMQVKTGQLNLVGVDPEPNLEHTNRLSVYADSATTDTAIYAEQNNASGYAIYASGKVCNADGCLGDGGGMVEEIVEEVKVIAPSDYDCYANPDALVEFSMGTIRTPDTDLVSANIELWLGGDLAGDSRKYVDLSFWDPINSIEEDIGRYTTDDNSVCPSQGGSISWDIVWNGDVTDFVAATNTVLVRARVSQEINISSIAVSGVITLVEAHTEIVSGTPPWVKNSNDIYYNDGNVGIGTFMPNSLLHIYDTSTNAELDIQSVAGTNRHWGIYQDSSTEDLNFWHEDSNDILTLTNEGGICLSGDCITEWPSGGGGIGACSDCDGRFVKKSSSGDIDINSTGGSVDIDSYSTLYLTSNNNVNIGGDEVLMSGNRVKLQADAGKSWIDARNGIEMYSREDTVKLTASDGNSIEILSEGRIDLDASSGVYINGSPADLAEFMDVLKTDQAEEGEIVSLVGNNKLGKTNKKYDRKLIGVISGDRTSTLHIGDKKPLYDDTESLPIALVGRVFVKVNDEGGNIQVGDPITSSSVPGIGMKADKTVKIIGYAMESENFEKGEDNSEVMVFINVGYYFSE